MNWITDIKDDEITEIYSDLTNSLSDAVKQISNAISGTTRAFKDLANVLNKYQINNWRKFHHIPMKRRRRR